MSNAEHNEWLLEQKELQEKEKRKLSIKPEYSSLVEKREHILAKPETTAMEEEEDSEE